MSCAAFICHMNNTVKELTVVFAKIVHAIDNRSNEEYKVYSRKLQDTFKI